MDCLRRDCARRTPRADPRTEVGHMRSAYFLGGLFAVAAATALLAVRPASSTARNEEKKESSKSPTAALLPVAQVVLFSSGVGYFQREGSIDGDQRIDLTFPTQDINDLFK